MDIPLKTIITQLFDKKAGFNVVHFKALDNDNTPHLKAHFFITIALPDEHNIILNMITTQYQKLAIKHCANYLPNFSECFIPLDKEDFSCLTKNCIINCNEAKLLDKTSFEKKIHKENINHPLTIKHCDNEFESGLKKRIIEAIEKSPTVRLDIKKYIINAKQNLYNDLN